ncbi:MAG: acetylglutamate kinase [Proteobacteria bacterium]|nr:acetylglutamate kinase [Cystobacterineae bacterium]MCL2314199.1 acetylglutamate kinase [Pseudomonadota bacterium]
MHIAPFLAPYKGQWFVIKIGGELALDKQALAHSLGMCVGHMLEAGVRVVLVHGGGPQATALSNRLGLITQQVDGQRVTDEATMEVMKMVLAGQVSSDVASAMRMAHVPALCLSGLSAGLVLAKRLGDIPSPHTPTVDLGLVGHVYHVETPLLEKLSSLGLVPVLSSLADDGQGGPLNVNADNLAAQLAKGLGASHLFLLSNVPGVLEDVSNPQSRYPHLSGPQVAQLIASRKIYGGMLPKVEGALLAARESRTKVHLLSLSPPASLLEALKNPGSVGTTFEA